MDGTAVAISGQKFWEGGVKVILDEGGNNIVIAIRDDKIVMGAHYIEVVLPPRTRVDTRLRTSWGRSLILLVSLHGHNPCVLV